MITDHRPGCGCDACQPTDDTAIPLAFAIVATLLVIGVVLLVAMLG